MAYIVTDNLADKKTCNQDTDDRVYKIEPVERMGIEASSQQMLDKVDKMFEGVRGKRREDTNQQTQQQNELILRYMLLAPFYKAVKQADILFILFHHSLITVTVPLAVSLIILEDFALPFSSCL